MTFKLAFPLRRVAVVLSIGLSCLTPALAQGPSAAPQAGASTPAPALAHFANGEVITGEDLQRYVERRIDLRPVVRSYWGVEQALREMALTRTLVLEGDRIDLPRRSIQPDPRFDDIYGQAVYAKLTLPCERPADEAAARQYFDAHPEAFQLPPSVRVSRVMLPVKELIDGVPAMTWMTNEAMALSGGKTTLEAIVQRAEAAYRLDPQGDLGWVLLEGDNAIIRVLTGARQGELVGPVREGDFAYLYYLADKREGRPLKWEEIKASAAKRAVVFCTTQTRERLQAELFKKYGVQFDAKGIRTLFADLPTSPDAPASK